MTDKDITKALECCSYNDCTDCPLKNSDTFDECTRLLSTYSLDLIKRQEELIAENATERRHEK